MLLIILGNPPGIGEMKLLPFLMSALLGMSTAQGEPLIVAHRGASAVAPENTLAAFQEAWRQGADAIEGDFRLTKDGRIVTVHDDTTKRTTPKNLVVAETNWADLKDLDAGSWKGKKWSSERIPLLSEVLAGVPKGKGIFIEVKCGPDIVAPLLKVLAASQIELAQVTVIAFDKEVIRSLKKSEPRIKANWLTGFKKSKVGTYSPDLAATIATLKEVGADGLGAEAVEDLADGLGKNLRQNNFGYHVWTVDSAKIGRQFVEAGVQSVTTNLPETMRSFLAE